MDIKKIINPWTGMEGYNCIGCAPNNPFGVHLCFYEDGEDIMASGSHQPTIRGGSTPCMEAYKRCCSTKYAAG